jgi:lipopolysaccharide transport system permease protein
VLLSGSAPAADEPLIRIRPRGGWQAIGVRDLWEYRDLFRILMLRDVKLRYKQTALGVTWVVLQPVVAAVIFSLIFGRLANLPSDGIPYPVFVYAGLLPWQLFSGALQRAGNSLVSQSALISKIYFPRMIIPMSSASAVLIDFAVALTALIVLLFLYGVPLAWTAILLPLIVAIVLANAIGVSLFLSGLNVYYRDFGYAFPFILQVWMYASPLVYSSSLVPAAWRPLFALNPMVGGIEGFRWALFNRGDFPIAAVGISAAMGLVLLTGGALVFRRVERGFADVV